MELLALKFVEGYKFHERWREGGWWNEGGGNGVEERVEDGRWLTSHDRLLTVCSLKLRHYVAFVFEFH